MPHSNLNFTQNPQLVNRLADDQFRKVEQELNKIIDALYEDEGFAIFNDKEFYDKFKREMELYWTIAQDKRRDKKTSSSHLKAASELIKITSCSDYSPSSSGTKQNDVYKHVLKLQKSGAVKEQGWNWKLSYLYQLLDAYERWYRWVYEVQPMTPEFLAQKIKEHYFSEKKSPLAISPYIQAAALEMHALLAPFREQLPPPESRQKKNAAYTAAYKAAQKHVKSSSLKNTDLYVWLNWYIERYEIKQLMPDYSLIADIESLQGSVNRLVNQNELLNEQYLSEKSRAGALQNQNDQLKLTEKERTEETQNYEQRLKTQQETHFKECTSLQERINQKKEEQAALREGQKQLQVQLQASLAQQAQKESQIKAYESEIKKQQEEYKKQQQKNEKEKINLEEENRKKEAKIEDSVKNINVEILVLNENNKKLTKENADLTNKLTTLINFLRGLLNHFKIPFFTDNLNNAELSKPVDKIIIEDSLTKINTRHFSDCNEEEFPHEPGFSEAMDLLIQITFTAKETRSSLLKRYPTQLQQIPMVIVGEVVRIMTKSNAIRTEARKAISYLSAIHDFHNSCTEEDRSALQPFLLKNRISKAQDIIFNQMIEGRIDGIQAKKLINGLYDAFPKSGVQNFDDKVFEKLNPIEINKNCSLDEEYVFSLINSLEYMDDKSYIKIRANNAPEYLSDKLFFIFLTAFLFIASNGEKDEEGAENNMQVLKKKGNHCLGDTSLTLSLSENLSKIFQQKFDDLNKINNKFSKEAEAYLESKFKNIKDFRIIMPSPSQSFRSFDSLLKLSERSGIFGKKGYRETPEKPKCSPTPEPLQVSG
jgi:hypothetical protein